jgi:hypothetical protein
MAHTLITFRKENATTWDIFDLISACPEATSLAYRLSTNDKNIKVLRGMVVYPNIDLQILTDLYPSFAWQIFDFHNNDIKFTDKDDSTSENNTTATYTDSISKYPI